MSETARKAKRSKVNPNESRDERFIRLANSRGEKLKHQMQLLYNLGDSHAYKIEPELAEALLEEFEDKLNRLKVRWKKAINKGRSDGKETDDSPAVTISSAE